MPPHPAAANSPNVYNAPRAPEVYTLADAEDATIPEEVREQFQRDEKGRVLFFTAPPLNRTQNRGVTEQYAGLGHSVSHLASISSIREERRRKRKERDDALAAEQAARKKHASENEAELRAQAEKEEREKAQAAEKALLDWCRQMNEDTRALEEALGGEEERKRSREQMEAFNKLSEAEKRTSSIKWWVEDCVRRGTMDEEEKGKWDDLIGKSGNQVPPV